MDMLVFRGVYNEDMWVFVRCKLRFWVVFCIVSFIWISGVKKKLALPINQTETLI